MSRSIKTQKSESADKIVYWEPFKHLFINQNTPKRVISKYFMYEQIGLLSGTGEWGLAGAATSAI